MSYLINRFSGSELVVLEDGTVDVSTDLSLVGRNTVGYGELQNENFVFLLENFSNANPPSRPISGQLWHASNDNSLNVYNGTEWLKVGSATFSATQPDAQTGGFWIRTTDNTLHYYNGLEWFFVGPESAEGFETTRFESSTLLDTTDTERPVILLKLNGVTYGILTDERFTIDQSNAVDGFDDLVKGLNLRNNFEISGNLNGVASRATILDTTRTINGIGFNGSANINITAPTQEQHIRGDYLTGANFDGSTEVTWNVDASELNRAGKIVARDIQGNFSAGTITANLIGNVTGNVTASEGTSSFARVEAAEFIGATLSGNAFSATKLQSARQINGVFFDGTTDITVTADAKTLTNNELNSTVVNSNLETVGTLVNLNVADQGLNIGTGQIIINSTANPKINATSRLDIGINENNYLSFIDGNTSLSLGGDNTDTVFGAAVNLGHTNNKFSKVYADSFIGDVTGNATTSTSSVSSSNLVGGGSGALPYQVSSGNTTFLAPGTPGQILKLNGAALPFWDNIAFATLTAGQYINGLNYTGDNAITWSVDATDFNTANKVVARDASGNFSAGTITANITGNVTGNITGNATSADSLSTARQINGVAFNGTADITITATDPNAIPNTGGFVSGNISTSAIPTDPTNLTNKDYVDDAIDNAVNTNNALFGQIKAFVRFDGNNVSNIKKSLNVDSVVLESSGQYRINITPGTMTDSNYIINGIATDTDHFVSLSSSDVNFVRIFTIDNGSGNDSPSTTSGDVMVTIIE